MAFQSFEVIQLNRIIRYKIGLFCVSVLLDWFADFIQVWKLNTDWRLIMAVWFVLIGKVRKLIFVALLNPIAVYYIYEVEHNVFWVQYGFASLK